MKEQFGSFTFQSTLPVWGATRVLAFAKEVPIISIHAPRVGSDVTTAVLMSHVLMYFNPRSPCGERL